jgi:uncharacterized protein (DUF433 family)
MAGHSRQAGRLCSVSLVKSIELRYISFQKHGKIMQMASNRFALMTANEAASVTGVPLRQVHRIIDAGLLDGPVKRLRNARLLPRDALVGLRLAHDTADVLTPETRRAVVTSLLRRPRRSAIRAAAVVVDARPAARAVRAGLKQLAKARQVVSSSREVLGGTVVFRGTRIPVHDIADMLANGDAPTRIVKAYPQLDQERVRLAAIYAAAYPRRGRPPIKPTARRRYTKTVETTGSAGRFTPSSARRSSDTEYADRSQG